MKKQSFSSCLAWLTKELSSLDLHEHTREQYARWLIEEATQQLAFQVIIQDHLSNEACNKLEQYLKELKSGKPLGYILSVPFCGLTLHVEPPILIPRMETEEWVDTLIAQLKKETHKNLRILDLCTGSGCIALSLARHLPEATVIGIDIKEEALICARENAIQNNISNVTFVHSNLFEALVPQEFDLIVSNPPYISESDFKQLPESVRNWEDPLALVAPDDGLAILKKIILMAPAWLTKTRIQITPLWLEIGFNQAHLCVDFLEKNNYKDVTVHSDSFGNNRIVTGRVNEAQDTLSLSKKRIRRRRPY